MLVVAADDGIMPQTPEAIEHARAAGVPMVVALNKIDVPNANQDRVIGELSEGQLSPRSTAGTPSRCPCRPRPAKASMSSGEYPGRRRARGPQGEPQGSCERVRYRGERDPGRGPVATLLLSRGTLERAMPCSPERLTAG